MSNKFHRLTEDELGQVVGGNGGSQAPTFYPGVPSSSSTAPKGSIAPTKSDISVHVDASVKDGNAEV